MKPWVLVDVSYLAHRARMALEGLEFEDYPTGVIFGFFTQLLTICTHPKIQSSRVALFMDSKESIRQQAYPIYKIKRREDKTPEELQQRQIMYEQIRLLKKEILPAMGFNVYRQTGLESDDLMAYAALEIGKITDVKDIAYPRAIIVTGDGDLYQCITEQIHWFDPGREKYYTPKTFQEAKFISPHLWSSVKAIAGCHTDCVGGIPGVGEKTAIQWLTGKGNCTLKRFQRIVSAEGKKVIQFNLPLVKLPHEKTKPFKVEENHFNLKEFKHQFRKYGLLSFLKKKNFRRWRRFADNNMSAEDVMKKLVTERKADGRARQGFLF